VTDRENNGTVCTSSLHLFHQPDLSLGESHILKQLHATWRRAAVTHVFLLFHASYSTWHVSYLWASS